MTDRDGDTAFHRTGTPSPLRGSEVHPPRQADPTAAARPAVERRPPAPPPAAAPQGPLVLRPTRPAARPTVVDELAILGLSRRSRSRRGSRLFTAFFVFVFAVILVQMVVELLTF